MWGYFLRGQGVVVGEIGVWIGLDRGVEVGKLLWGFTVGTPRGADSTPQRQPQLAPPPQRQTLDLEVNQELPVTSINLPPTGQSNISFCSTSK